jgi:putative addiction module killer protein
LYRAFTTATNCPSEPNPLSALKKVQFSAYLSAHYVIARLSLGNFGDHKPISDGLSELRIDTGPGYRVYYTRRGKTLIMLLIGGAKGTQKRDIKRALEMMKQLEG